MQLDFPLLQVCRRVEQFKHKLLVIPGVYPGRADPDADFRSGQVFGLHLFQLFGVDGKLRVFLGGGAGNR